jgi:hypothetical protein
MRKFIWIVWLSLLFAGALHAQTKDSVTMKANVLRDEFVNKIKAAGFTPSLPPPMIVFDNPRSYGNYSADSNILHTSDWKTLDTESKGRFEASAASGGNGMTGERYFELTAHQWILIHELGHWWRACQHQTAKPYENEMAANRIAIAFWREKDPAFMEFKRAGYQRMITVMRSPVPEGQAKSDYLNTNYDKLPGGQAYTWYQATMIVDGCAEMPVATFKEMIGRAGNAIPPK